MPRLGAAPPVRLKLTVPRGVILDIRRGFPYVSWDWGKSLGALHTETVSLSLLRCSREAWGMLLTSSIYALLSILHLYCSVKYPRPCLGGLVARVKLNCPLNAVLIPKHCKIGSPRALAYRHFNRTVQAKPCEYSFSFLATFGTY